MVKIYKKKRLRVLLRFFSVLFLGLFLIFSVIHLYLGQTLRAVEDQYIEETAILYVKNINRKIQSINQEFLMLANNLRNILPGIPQNISPRDGGYYDVLFMASDLVGSLKTRYPELLSSPFSTGRHPTCLHSLRASLLHRRTISALPVR